MINLEFITSFKMITNNIKACIINIEINLYYLLFKLFIICIILFLIYNHHINLKESKSHKEYNLLNFNNNIKICVCTPGKRENRYIMEFIQYYEKYGVDTIFLYDNNEINDEHFEDVIKDYVDKGFVKILNWRGRKKTGYSLRNDCYSKNKKKYNWLFFYDLDEYIYLRNYTNIKSFLNQPKFKKCLKINLNWIIHTDNNLIYYDNRTLHERFPEIQQDIKKEKNKYKGIYRYKFILQGKIQNNKIDYYYLISKNFSGCNGNGKQSQLITDKFMKNPDFENFYIDHYYFKSVEEFIEKINKGDNYFGKKLFLKKIRIKRFFQYNKITKQKLKFIHKNTGIDLSEFKKKIKI